MISIFSYLFTHSFNIVEGKCYRVLKYYIYNNTSCFYGRRRTEISNLLRVKKGGVIMDLKNKYQIIQRHKDKDVRWNILDQGFLNLVLFTFWARQFLVWRALLGMKTVSRLLGFYPLHANSTSSIVKTKNVSWCCRMFPGWGAKLTPVEYYWYQSLIC